VRAAEVEMIVLSPFAVCSPVASSCTGDLLGPKIGKGEVLAPVTGKQGQFFGRK
jgi:hypothetical protein